MPCILQLHLCTVMFWPSRLVCHQVYKIHTAECHLHNSDAAGWMMLLACLCPQNITKQNRAKTEPCGTSQVTGRGEVKSDPKWTDCVRSSKYDWNHRKAKLLTPKVIDNLLSRISWSTVSNAADKSRRVNNANSSFSMASTRSEKTFRTAVSVECIFL